ncbi:MAG: T9SS type A sorting domain-containing protein, partial [Bacteroidetes bacterium]|nr:T9SS type A sorting domain-containing protein [Bacteroidota bacterium]
DGHGTTNQSHTYQLRDDAPEKGSNYYRLVQHDIDHNSEIIKTIVAEVRDGLSAISLFPNPVRTDTEVTLVMNGLRPKAEQEVQVIDIQGRIHTILRITTDESGSFRGQLKTDLTQGLYVIKINASILKLVVY